MKKNLTLIPYLGESGKRNNGFYGDIRRSWHDWIKLIERWNKSDEISLRHREDVIREIGDLSEKVSYVSGRINGSQK